MKRLIAVAALCVLLAGCAPSGPTNEELGWDEDWVRVGTCWAWSL